MESTRERNSVACALDDAGLKLGGVVASAAKAVDGGSRALGFVVHGLAAAATGVRLTMKLLASRGPGVPRMMQE